MIAKESFQLDTGMVIRVLVWLGVSSGYALLEVRQSLMHLGGALSEARSCDLVLVSAA